MWDMIDDSSNVVFVIDNQWAFIYRYPLIICLETGNSCDTSVYCDTIIFILEDQYIGIDDVSRLVDANIPTMFNDKAIGSITLENAQPISCELIDGLGRSVKRSNLVDRLLIHDFKIEDLEGLSPGTYILQITGEDFRYATQLVKPY